MNGAVTLKGEPMIVMTREEYEALRDDVGDAAIGEQARWQNSGAPAMPSDLVDAIFDKGLHPLGAWRLSASLTEADLAERSGVPEAVIREIENRQIDPRLSTLKALAATLNLGIEDIVD